MEKEQIIIKRIFEKMNWREKIVLKIFAKEFVKAYNICRIDFINSYLKIY